MHYVCTGQCHGVADHQKNCDSQTCSMYQKPLIACNCTDGKHEAVSHDHHDHA